MDSTVIDSPDFLITSDRDETVEGFSAYKNSKFEHLPINIGEKFPNLIALQVYNCSVKRISKDSFKGLSKLRRLYIYHNQIEQIDDDVFEHIPAVEEIYFSE